MTRVEEQIRADIVEAGRRLYARSYIASNDGNISARLDDRRVIATPKGVSKGFMTPDMMVIVDYDGHKVAGERDPSTELRCTSRSIAIGLMRMELSTPIHQLRRVLPLPVSR